MNALVSGDSAAGHDLKTSKDMVGSDSAAGHDLDTSPEDKGMLHEADCSVLMKILYAARMARPDLRRPTVRLSSYVTKWNSFRDTPLHRLICYIWSTLDYMQEGHIAERDVQSLACTAYTDTDFAGCVETQISTTGGHACLEGSKAHFVIHPMSKKTRLHCVFHPRSGDCCSRHCSARVTHSCSGYLGVLQGTTPLIGALKEDNEAAIQVM